MVFFKQFSIKSWFGFLENWAIITSKILVQFKTSLIFDWKWMVSLPINHSLIVYLTNETIAIYVIKWISKLYKSFPIKLKQQTSAIKSKCSAIKLYQ